MAGLGSVLSKKKILAEFEKYIHGSWFGVY